MQKQKIGVEQILQAKAIQAIKRENEAGLRVILGVLISDFCTFFNVKRGINGEQITSTIDLILEFYEHFKIEDFVVCFKKAKVGAYGKLYEGIDGAKIMDILGQYDNEREADIVKYHQDKNNAYKRNLLDVDKSVTDSLKKIIKEPEVKKAEPKKIERTEEQKIFDAYVREFDKMWNIPENIGKSGMRFIDYKGKKMDIQTYVNERFKEDFK